MSSHDDVTQTPLGLAGRRGLTELLSVAFGHDDAPEPFGRFSVGRRLGAGAFGEVFAATDPRTDREIAIKVLHTTSAQPEIDRLRREARAMAQVDHPNLVTVYEVGRHERRDYIAMELVDGPTLKQWGHKHPSDEPERWRQALALLCAAGRGLAAAHATGLVHRDFKPANVLIAADGTAKVADFGLAKIASESSRESGDTQPDAPIDLSEHTLTRTGAVMGTPRYMAPEQHMGKKVDARSDQFSFGVTAWELLHGQPPFAGRTRAMLLDAIAAGHVREPSDRRVPAGVNAALRRAMSAAAIERFASMNALLEAIEHAARPPRRWWPWLAGVGAVAATAAAVVWWSPNATSKPEACPAEPVEARASELWNETQQQALHAALSSTEVPYAAETSRTIDTSMGNFVERWTRARQDACAAVRIEGTATEATFDGWLSCLDETHAQGRAVVDTFTSGELDPKLAERAVRVVDQLPDPRHCLRRTKSRDADPTRTAELRGQLARARTRYQAGHYEVASEAAAQITEAATEAKFETLRGDALELLALAKSAHSHGTGLDSLQLAYDIALSLDDGESAARRAAIATMQYLAEQPDLSEQWLRHADTALARADGVSVEVRAHVERSRCRLLEAGRKLDAALAACRRASAILQGDPSSNPRQRWSARLDTSNVLRTMGKEAEAVELLSALRAEAIERYGPEHPSVGGTTMNMANSLEALGEPERAATMHEQAQRVFEVSYGPNHPWVVSALLNRGRLWSDRDPPRAIELFEQGLEKCGDRRDARTLRILRMLANAHRKHGQFDRAEALLARAKILQEEVLPPDHPDRWFTVHILGMLATDRGQLEKAERLFGEALDVIGEEATPERATILMHTARVLLERDRPAEALRRAAESERIHASRNVAPQTRASNLVYLCRAQLALGRHEAARSCVELGEQTIARAHDAEKTDIPENLAALRKQLGEPTP